MKKKYICPLITDSVIVEIKEMLTSSPSPYWVDTHEGKHEDNGGYYEGGWNDHGGWGSHGGWGGHDDHGEHGGYEHP